MVARINTSKSISKVLNYNEQKLKQGKAEILSASGFLKDAVELNFYEKIKTFQKLTSLNDRATTNALHVSLNFDPSEKLSNDNVIAIADTYMQKIGFGEQPYLVYRHYDSGHPHIHIISTNIKRGGKRISMHNLGRNQSESARKEIEKEYKLIKAEDKKNTDILKLVPVQASKVLYGKGETRRAISNILGPVLTQYKFSSLPELNAILKLYNIAANQGEEGSRIYKNKGITYHILDEHGNKVGLPQKASSFFMKPTLNKLEKLFAENHQLKQQHKKNLIRLIDWQLFKKQSLVKQLVTALEKDQITVVLRKGKQDIIFGITYIDHRSKCVFNGSDLGKQYSAKGILEKCNHLQSEILVPFKEKQDQQSESVTSQKHLPQESLKEAEAHRIILPESKNIIEHEYAQGQWKKKRKRKRKKLH